MHIVYVIAPGGGPEVYVRTLLPWLQRQGHRVSIVYTVAFDRSRHDYPADVRVMHAPPDALHYYASKLVGGIHAWPRRLRSWEQARAVYQAVVRIDREEPVDVVEVTEGLPVRHLKSRWGIVVRAHGSDWTVRHFCRDREVRWDPWLVAAEARQLRDAHVASPLSHHLADYLSGACNLPREILQPVPYPIDVNVFQSNASAERDAPTTPAVLSVGRLERRKGMHLLLQAMSVVWKKFPTTKVFLIGREADLTREQLREIVAPDKRGNLITPGSLPYAQLPDYYRRTTAYVTPTQYEAFGYTILEAMASGLPVIGSRVGAVPELIEHGKTGLLVPFGDIDALAEAINRVISNAALAKDMGISGKNKALQYALPKIGPKHEALYEKALREAEPC